MMLAADHRAESLACISPPPPPFQFLRKTISRPPSRSGTAHARDVNRTSLQQRGRALRGEDKLRRIPSPAARVLRDAAEEASSLGRKTCLQLSRKGPRRPPSPSPPIARSRPRVKLCRTDEEPVVTPVPT